MLETEEQSFTKVELPAKEDVERVAYCVGTYLSVFSKEPFDEKWSVDGEKISGFLLNPKATGDFIKEISQDDSFELVVDQDMSERAKVKKNLVLAHIDRTLVCPFTKYLCDTGWVSADEIRELETLKKDLLKNSNEFAEVEIIYPVHLNPNVFEPVYRYLHDLENVHLLGPISYPYLVWLMNKSYLVLSDSGGIQEEAPSLGKPVLVTREVTERAEGIKAGTAKLVGTNREKIVSSITELLTNPALYKKMSRAHNPYGDGKASERIVKIILDQ